MSILPAKRTLKGGVMITQHAYTEHVFKIIPGDHDNTTVRLTVEAQDPTQLCNMHLKHNFKQTTGQDGNKRIIEQYSEFVLTSVNSLNKNGTQ